MTADDLDWAQPLSRGQGHDVMVHRSGPEHVWLTCSCGWIVDPAPDPGLMGPYSWDAWYLLVAEHLAAEGIVTCSALVVSYSDSSRRTPCGVAATDEVLIAPGIWEPACNLHSRPTRVLNEMLSRLGLFDMADPEDLTRVINAVLLPAVEDIARERAAKELEYFARDWQGWPATDMRATDLADLLARRAADLRDGDR